MRARSDAKTCNTKVTLTAQIGSDAEQTLGEWDVVYANDWIIARVDMASKGLAGKPVVLRYYVRANGAASQDRVLFLSPFLRHRDQWGWIMEAASRAHHPPLKLQPMPVEGGLYAEAYRAGEVGAGRTAAALYGGHDPAAPFITH